MTKFVNSDLVNKIEDLIEMRIPSEINQPLLFGARLNFAFESSSLAKSILIAGTTSGALNRIFTICLVTIFQRAVLRACVSMGASGVCHPQNFRTSHLRF